MQAKNIKVTTSSGFEGITIEQYLEPITAHVVVGMNVFKDIFSGLSDFFGGKSESYQKTLNQINEGAINKLREKAYSIGGNCVVGLKIDNDEISGQGKGMLMVTAVGTAAKADFNENSINITKEVNSERVSSELLNTLKQKNTYLQKAKNGSLRIREEFWNFVKENAIHELAPYITDQYLKFAHIDYVEGEETKFFNNVVEYFSVIDQQFALDYLFNKLKEDISPEERQKLTSIIKHCKLIDFSRISELLNNSDFNIQKAAVSLSNAEKLNYEKSDVPLIDNLITILKENFNQRGKITNKKKALSSKEKEIWICGECEAENSMNNEYCASCGKNIYGFLQEETKPGEVISKLENESEILKSFLE